mgnify:CR=1 FL=1
MQISIILCHLISCSLFLIFYLYNYEWTLNVFLFYHNSESVEIGSFPG